MKGSKELKGGKEEGTESEGKEKHNDKKETYVHCI